LNLRGPLLRRGERREEKEEEGKVRER